MHILITGGLGFIGREVSRQLLAEGGHRLTIVDTLSPQVHGEGETYPDITDRDDVTFVQADIADPGVLADALSGGVDAVIHLAAETGTGQSMYEIERYYRTNVTGTAILLEELVKTPELRPDCVLLASSRSIYGEGAYVKAGDEGKDGAARHYPSARSVEAMENGEFDFAADDGTPLVPVATHETDPADPRSLYAASKLAQEQMCRIACESVGIRFHALRLQNVYGPGQSLKNPYTGILSIFTNILRQDGQIDIFEDGEESRDFVYVGDVARAFRTALTLPGSAPDAMNVGLGKAYTVSEMVAMLEAKMDRPQSSRISGRFRPGDIRHNYADIGRMKEHLGFAPEMDLPEGLSRTVDWALGQPVEEDRSEKATRELAGFLKRG